MDAPQANQDDSPPEARGFSERLRTLLVAIRGLPGQASRRPGRSLLILAAVVVGLAGAATAWLLIGGGENRSSVSISNALAELNTGNLAEARRVAAELRYGNRLRYEELGGPVYILGAAMAREAAAHWSPHERQKLYLIAARYLEEARDRGFPPGYEADGLSLLGECLCRGGHYAESIPALHAALENDPSHRSAICRLLSQAYLRDSDPQLDKALRFNQECLKDPTLPPDDRHAGLLEQSWIQFEKGEPAAAIQSLSQIPQDAKVRSEAILMQARLLIDEGDRILNDPKRILAGDHDAKAREKYAAAMNQLRLAQGYDTSANQTTRKAEYLMGVCYRKMGDVRAAQEQFARVGAGNVNTAERVSAALEEGEIQRELKKYEPALASYRRALQDAGAPETYSNSWISLSQFRDRVLAAYDDFLQAQQFQQAIELSKLLSPILDRARSVQLEAEAHQKWGEHLSRSAAQLARSQAAPLLDQARAQFRRAAVQYERLARLWITRREHPDALWLSAENCMNGRNYDQAVRMLARYLENETRRRRPRALVMMGEAYLALGKVDQALAPLLECIEFHSKDPDSYRARLIASQAYLERGDTDKAKELLSDNLHNEELTPKSSEWRDSLFALGQVLHRQGVELASKSRFKGLDSAAGPAKVGAEELEKSRDAHLEAVKTLCEAVERYPDAPQAIQARYSIAESHRRAAEWPRKQRAATTIETQRTALTEQVRRELEEALKIYDSLIELLNQRQDASEPSEVERAAMRNCYFARGDVLFDLERCEDAIAAYSSAANRYHDQPESLEAFIQISRCYRALGRLSEARGALEQAKVILKRIPADADFANTTHYDRNGWVQFLNWRSTL